MTDLLAALDGFTVAAILVKAAMYLASLVAAGSALFAAFLSQPGRLPRQLAGLAAVAAVAAFALTATLVAMRAAFLGGGRPEAALDPVLLSIVLESPLGTSATIRAVGLALVCAVLAPHRAGVALAAGGAVLVAASFALIGHALGEPRALLGALVTVHLLAAAFWIGALAPLHALAGRTGPTLAGEVARRFGSIAVPVVGALLAAGIVLALVIAGGPGRLTTTAYGQLVLAKVALVASLLGLAAHNKLRLTPALLAGQAAAAAALRRSIRWEGAIVVAILLVTATFTTVTNPERQGGLPSIRVATAGIDAGARVGPRGRVVDAADTAAQID